MSKLSNLSRSIKGKVVLITGAGSGMGRATAHLFSDEGAKVIVTDINKDRADRVTKEITDSKGEAINLEFDSPLDEKEANEILSNSEGISVIDHRKDEGYVTPVEIAGEDKVYVSRIRNDQSIDNGLNLWVVSDNLRKGAALNAVQIAELVISKYSNYIKI